MPTVQFLLGHAVFVQPIIGEILVHYAAKVTTTLKPILHDVVHPNLLVACITSLCDTHDRWRVREAA